jgi:hypothetical protein
LEHPFPTAASDTVRVAKFVVIKAIDAAGTAAGANGLSVTLDAQLVADIKAIEVAVKAVLPPVAAPAK